MRVFLEVHFLIVEVFFYALANQKVDINIPNNKQWNNTKLKITHPLSNIKLIEIQKRRDLDPYLHYLNRNRDKHCNEFSTHRNREKLMIKLQNKIPHPFEQYGPPKDENVSVFQKYNHKEPKTNNLKSEAPNSLKTSTQTEDVIASQNDQPFGKNTANYLPPKNQKLPLHSAPHLFANIPHHNFQQQQQNRQYHPMKSNSQYFQKENIKFSNLKSVSNIFANQQISDATLFLTQNAQAISSLYGAPASNENYAPYNKNVKYIENQYDDQQNLKHQVIKNNQFNQLQNFNPSHTFGISSSQESIKKVKPLENNRLVIQLQSGLSNQQINDSYYYYYPENKPFTHSTEDGTPLKKYRYFLPSANVNAVEGNYQLLAPATTQFHTSPILTTLAHPDNSAKDSIQKQHGLITPTNLIFNTMTPEFTKYEGFVIPPTSTSNFIPNFVNYKSPLESSAPVDSSYASPTRFSIPIPMDSNYNQRLLSQVVSKIPKLTSISSRTAAYLIPSNIIFPTKLYQFDNANPSADINLVTKEVPTYGLNQPIANPLFKYNVPQQVHPLHQNSYPARQ